MWLKWVELGCVDLCGVVDLCPDVVDFCGLWAKFCQTSAWIVLSMVTWSGLARLVKGRALRGQ